MNTFQAKEILESVRNARFPAWHFRMLNDRNRNDAYRRAIRSLIAAGCGNNLSRHLVVHQTLMIVNMRKDISLF